MFPKLRKENPDLQKGQYSLLISDLWLKLSDKEKQKYYKRAE